MKLTVTEKIKEVILSGKHKPGGRLPWWFEMETDFSNGQAPV
jgi:hypothetical protein